MWVCLQLPGLTSNLLFLVHSTYTNLLLRVPIQETASVIAWKTKITTLGDWRQHSLIKSRRLFTKNRHNSRRYVWLSVKFQDLKLNKNVKMKATLYLPSLSLSFLFDERKCGKRDECGWALWEVCFQLFFWSMEHNWHWNTFSHFCLSWYTLIKVFCELKNHFRAHCGEFNLR